MQLLLKFIYDLYCYTYLLYIIKYLKIQKYMTEAPKRSQLIKSQDGQIHMSQKNLKICNKNQNRYQTPQLNDAFELHYYGFVDIANLQPYANINTLYLNNNAIVKIQNLSHLNKLATLNLANNRIVRIQNLEKLTQLFILDLSGNKIQQADGLQTLQKLTTLNLSSNMLHTPKSIEHLHQNKALTCLNISSNPLPDELQLFDYLQKIPLLTLFLKDTKFSRGVPSYRKQTIHKMKLLTFLDQRPVTHDQRMMIQAWKTGGIQAEKQARKLIQETKQQKNKKIYEQMMQRSAKVQKLRDALFIKNTVHEHEQLVALKSRLLQQKQKQPCDDFQINLLNTKIQQLQCYLKDYRQDVNYMDVSEKPQVPNNLNQRHEPDAIYIYGVTEAQLPKIKQKYYPDQTRPLIAVEMKLPEQVRWVQNYDQIMEHICKEYLNKSELILPVFNMKIHDFDRENNRKSRRFKQEQISAKITKLTKKQSEQEVQKLHKDESQLNQLD